MSIIYYKVSFPRNPKVEKMEFDRETDSRLFLGRSKFEKKGETTFFYKTREEAYDKGIEMLQGLIDEYQHKKLLLEQRKRCMI
jgi:hypothetical protein